MADICERMKAAVYRKYGGPEVLQILEVPKSSPGSDGLLVRVHATSVNRTDCANLTGKPWIMHWFLGLTKPSKPIAGTEFAGVVTQVGTAVNSFKEGDRVFGFHDGGIGAHAEYMVIKEKQGVLHWPDDLPFTSAIGVEGTHYAYNFLNKVELQKGDRALVNGATGAIGSATVQLLVERGIHVTAVCATPHRDLVKSLGAERVIDYTKTDFTRGKERFKFVFDSVGKSSFGKCKRILEPGGVYMSSELGYMAQNPLYTLVSGVFGGVPGQKGRKVKFPVPTNVSESLGVFAKLSASGHMAPVVDRTYPIEEIAQAFAYVLTGQKIGNVVIAPVAIGK